MFRRLLIPLDGSTMAESVVPSAVRLAEKAGASVTLLHLIEKNAPSDIHGGHHLSNCRDAENYLRAMAETHFAKLDVSWHVHGECVRNVARSVSSHAEEFRPDLIVMCAHDHRGWLRWLGGSLGQQVVRHTMPPVLLFQYVDQLSPSFPFDRVLIPLDGNVTHETGVEAGGELARLSGAPIELLQVVPTRNTLGGPRGIAGGFLPSTTDALLEMAEEQTRQYLAQHLGQLTGQGLAGTASIIRGEPAEELIQYAEETKPGLIVLGTHGKIGSEAFWAGSVAQRLLDTCAATFLLASAKE